MTIASACGRQRFLSLWFPHLPTDRILRQRFGRSWRTDRADAAARAEPLALSHDDRGARRLAALCEKAEALGLQKGTGLADARAMHPELEVLEMDPEADMRLLEGLADWCDRYTPLVALDGADGLFLDITGCSHLHGGEEALVASLADRLRHQGFDLRAGLAGTPGAAWAAARYRTGAKEKCAILAPGTEEAALRSLPLAALRLDAETVRRLEGVGLRSAGALVDTPRAPLARRFGRQLLLRLDQALGRCEEPVSPRLPVPALCAERLLAEPVTGSGEIEHLAAMLCRSLKERLEERGQGARLLELALFRVDGMVHRIAVGTSRPVRDPEQIRRLLAERLEALSGQFDAGCGYELVRLAVIAAAPFGQEEAAAGDEDLAALVDRIHARFGPGVVVRPVAAASHVPERAVRHAPFGESAAAMPAETPPARLRPLRLLRRPEPVEAMAEVPEGPPVMFRWRRALYHVAAAEGPERVAPEWWREDGERTRDYYRIEDPSGRRYWLYRQGLYTEAGEAPRWFLHGIFA